MFPKLPDYLARYGWRYKRIVTNLVPLLPGEPYIVLWNDGVFSPVTGCDPRLGPTTSDQYKTVYALALGQQENAQ